MIGVQTQQILIPKQVYIGDTAELRCSFSSGEAVLKTLTSEGIKELSLEGFEEAVNFEEFEIKNVKLVPAGVDNYQFVITFVPWKTGEIRFSDYSIGSFKLSFEPVKIESLVAQNSISSLMESKAPILLPGTAYKLYALLILAVALLILLIRAVVKHEQLAFWIKNLQLKLKYRKNARETKKKITLILGKTESSSKDISSSLQKVLRNYLEVRFDYPFTKTVTSDFMKAYNEVTAGLLSDEKEEAFETFVSVFIRTDYIRYGNNIDFENGERERIFEALLKSIDVIETPEKENVEEEKNV